MFKKKGGDRCLVNFENSEKICLWGYGLISLEIDYLISQNWLHSKVYRYILVLYSSIVYFF